MTPLDTLRRQFDTPGIVEVHEGRGGLPVVRVTSPVATGEMYLHGGHVTSWVPTGGDEVLFVSQQARFEDGRAIRGGVPICYPWFGALADRPDAPAHGCVRTKTWQIDAVEQTDDGVAVTMSTASDDHSRGYWPGEFHLVHRVTFGRSLTMALTTTNAGTTSLDLQEALHTYYRVGSIHDVRIQGLERVRYLDALDARSERSQDGPITFTSEVDRIYLGPGTPITIDDPSLKRRLIISTERSHSTVVWNPWIRKAQTLADLGDDEWRDFVCVESCNVPPVAVPLGPGEQHVLRAVVEIG